MSDLIEVTDDINEFIAEVSAKDGFTSTARIKYFPGAAAGDGYISKAVAVDIEENGRSLHIFLKCALKSKSVRAVSTKVFETEILLYQTIYPTYQKFLSDKSISDGFCSVPECYGVLEKEGSEVVALENLRNRKFTLFNTFTLMNDKHLEMTFKAFAKFHAISFAMKDQHREVHDSYIDGRPNIYAVLNVMGFGKMFGDVVNEFVSKLDPVDDKDILDRCDNLAAKTTAQIIDLEKFLNEYATLIKGDCWVKNMMFLYEDGNEELPIDLMLIDWQGVTRGSPAIDLGSLFVQVSSEETLNNYQHYLNLYYDELCKRMRELGSDPEVLYPRHVWESDWVKYGLYSFSMGIICVKVMLCEKSNAPVFNDVSTEEFSSAADAFLGVNDHEDEVLKRWKYIARYMIKIGSF